jgi:hypothetical protein
MASEDERYVEPGACALMFVTPGRAIRTQSIKEIRTGVGGGTEVVQWDGTIIASTLPIEQLTEMFNVFMHTRYQALGGLHPEPAPDWKGK